jgi:hypothetical protein
MVIEEEVIALRVEGTLDPGFGRKATLEVFHVSRSGKDVMASMEDENGNVDPSCLLRRGFNHRAEGVKEAEGEGGDVIGVCLDLILMDDSLDHLDFLLAGEGFEGELESGKEMSGPAKGGLLPFGKVVVDSCDGRGEDEGVTGG